MDLSPILQSVIPSLLTSQPGGWLLRRSFVDPQVTRFYRHLADPHPVVRFTARNPYRLQVVGRVNQSLSLAGEELLVQNADAAVAAVCAHLGVGLANYTATALRLTQESQLACHLWLVELQTGAHVDPQTMAQGLDHFLIDHHYDYAKTRAAGARSGASFGLGPPCLLLLPSGAFQKWLHQRTQGQIGGQSKVPRLLQDSTVAGQILALLPSIWLDEKLARVEPVVARAVRQLTTPLQKPS